MNKQGFSLVELIAVVAIMALVTVIAIPAIGKIQDDILQKDYNSLIRNIETSAKDWAYDNLNKIKTDATSGNTNCYVIKIKLLIDDGYIKGNADNGNDIINPLTSESMRETQMCVVFRGTITNRILEAKIIGE